MKICIVTETYWPEMNGVANTLYHLVKGLVRLNCQIQLICPEHINRSKDDLGEGIDVHVCKSMSLPGYAAVNIGYPSKKLIKHAWQISRPDVVYVATEGPLGWQAVKLANAMGLHIVSGFHTNFQAYSRYYGLRLLSTWVKRYLVSFHNKTASTIVPSGDQANLVRNMGVNEVAVMGRGVDTELFAPERRCPQMRKAWGVKDNETVLLYVGRLAQEKNLSLAVKAYQQLKQQDQSLRFVMVGDGPLLSCLMQENPDIIFVGAQSGERLAQYYASADIFVFPSITETFGNVVLEAMASGLGVVAYDYAAAKKHIVSLYNGITVTMNDGNAFIDAVHCLCKNNLLLQKVRNNAAAHAQRFSWAVTVSRFIELLGLSPANENYAEPVYVDRLNAVSLK